MKNFTILAAGLFLCMSLGSCNDLLDKNLNGINPQLGSKDSPAFESEAVVSKSRPKNESYTAIDLILSYADDQKVADESFKNKIISVQSLKDFFWNPLLSLSFFQSLFLFPELSSTSRKMLLGYRIS